MMENHAASRGSRVMLCVIVLAAQALTLFPAYFVYLFLMGIGYGLAGKTGAVAGIVIAFACFVAMTFVAVYLATLPTRFSPSRVAGWTALALGSAIMLSGIVIVLIESLVAHEPKTLLERFEANERQTYEVAAMMK